MYTRQWLREAISDYGDILQIVIICGRPCRYALSSLRMVWLPRILHIKKMNNSREIAQVSFKALIDALGGCIPILGFATNVYENLSHMIGQEIKLKEKTITVSYK